ncbi:MAG: AraC family transcriptional regulator [Myxococcota bacterium]
MRHANWVDPDAVPHRFGLAEDLPALTSGWHHHRRPQLLYASEGALRLWAADRMVVLPPERAAWIGAGLVHRVEARRPVRLRTVYFLPEDEPVPGSLVVFSAPTLLTALAVHVCGWGPAPPMSPEGEPLLAAFAALATRWRAEPLAVELRAASSPELERALLFLVDHLDRPVAITQAARAGGLSVRTLQRRCREELGSSLRSWLAQARIVRALELLADPGLSVGEVALRTGHASPASFSRAFTAAMGTPPTRWRARVGPAP